MRQILRHALLWTCSIVALLAIASTAAADPPAPDNDSFYRAPANLASYPRGAIIRSRTVTVDIGPAPAAALGATSYQLLYRTNDASGHPVANVTTVIVPAGLPPSGGRQLVSLQDAEDSLTRNCAPSYQLQVGERDNADLKVEMPAAAPALLGTGRVLVVPDPYGPRSEFLVTAMEAHAILDSVRAAERFAPAQLGGIQTPVALVGYSGGGHETASAAQDQPRYAPELHLVAAAAGGVPAGDRQTYDYLDGRTGSGVIMGAMIALQRAHPRLGWSSLLNAYGRGVSAREQRGPGCVDPVVSGTDHVTAWTKVSNPLGVHRIARAISANALGHVAPTAPTFLYVSQHDQLISLPDSDRLAQHYCARHTPLDYYRDPSDFPPPLDDHLTSALAGFIPRALAYMNDRFAGAPIPDTCPHQSAPQPRCVSARTVTVSVHVPAGMRIARIRVFVNGRPTQTLHHGARRVRISLPKRATGALRITLVISGRRRGHSVTLRRGYAMHLCRGASATR